MRIKSTPIKVGYTEPLTFDMSTIDDDEEISTWDGRYYIRVSNHYQLPFIYVLQRHYKEQTKKGTAKHYLGIVLACFGIWRVYFCIVNGVTLGMIASNVATALVFTLDELVLMLIAIKVSTSRLK